MLPKGLGGLGDIGNMMKHALELKSNMERLKETLAAERIEGSSGGGMVTIVMSGRLEVLSVKIDPEIVNPEDPEMLETLVAAAMNEANRKAQEMVKEKMNELTGGIDIPGLTIPHPHLCERAFALAPLLDVMPAAVIGNRPARQWLAQLDRKGLNRIAGPEWANPKSNI